MTPITFTRIRPTVLVLHGVMGIVVAFCATQFGPGGETFNIVGGYVAGILATMHNILKDADDDTAKIRSNLVILSLMSGVVVCYFTWQFSAHGGLSVIVLGWVVAHLAAIKDLVKDEDMFEQAGAYGDGEKGGCRYPGKGAS